MLPHRVSASDARNRWVPLLRWASANGLPVEICRRQRESVMLVSAASFEAGLGEGHPWSALRFPRRFRDGFRPNGLKPGVGYRWAHASSTRIRDRLGSVLDSVDEGGQPLLVTRRGQCGMLLMAMRTFRQFGSLMPAAGAGARPMAGGVQ